MRRINMNKKGAEMTIGTLVIIVLAILVLVLLAFGFGTGWANLWDKIKAYTSGGVNVDSVKQACLVACTTQRIHEYCCVKREVRFATGEPVEKTNCNDDRLGLSQECSIDCSGVTCQTSGGVNVDSVKQACLVACTTQRTHEYCCVEREVRFATGEPVVKTNCNDDRFGLSQECNIDCSGVSCQTPPAAAMPKMPEAPAAESSSK